MASKYRAKSFYYDPLTRQDFSPKVVRQFGKERAKGLLFFASLHEFETYKILTKLSKSFQVLTQPEIEVIPPNQISCYPKGKTWKADFSVVDGNTTTMIVEAKGVITKDFVLTLALLELNNKEVFDKLWLVFSKQIPSNLVIKRLLKTPMRKRIIILSQFGKLAATTLM